MRVAIVLAAGRSRRFTGGNKLLARIDGEALVTRAVALARAAPVGRVIVVVGHDAARVAAKARGARVRLVRARDHRRGVSGSLRAGLSALWPIERIIYLYLGDTPAVAPGLTARLGRALAPEMAAVRPRGRAGPGHPVLLRRPSSDLVAGLRGDRGLGALIAGNTRWIRTKDPRAVDIDTRRDLARWR